MAGPGSSESSGKGVGSRIGQRLVKVLGIELQQATPYGQQVTRGESVYSINGATDAYIEAEPTVLEYFSRFRPTGRGVGQYFLSFFPFLTWMGRYATFRSGREFGG